MEGRQGVVLVVSGPSGSGKGTILKQFKSLHNDIVFSVSATTRSPRNEEQEGVHYFYKSTEEFTQMIEQGEFLEWVCYCDQYYGTPKSFIYDNVKSGKNIIVELEIHGAINIKKSFPESVLVFVMPPNFQDLRTRIENRASETPMALEKRLKRAKEEIELVTEYDYMIVNDKLDNAVQELTDILNAEKCRVCRQTDHITKIKKEAIHHEI